MIIPREKKMLHPAAVGYSFIASMKDKSCSCSVAALARSLISSIEAVAIAAASPLSSTSFDMAAEWDVSCAAEMVQRREVKDSMSSYQVYQKCKKLVSLSAEALVDTAMPI